jgi:hypothetical protein
VINLTAWIYIAIYTAVVTLAVLFLIWLLLYLDDNARKE